MAGPVVSALAEALVAAQADLPCALGKDATGQIQSRTYRYLTLDKLIEATKPILQKHGLTIVQWPSYIERGGEAALPALTTALFHTSGESHHFDMPLYVEPKTMQGLGAAITYARRYAWAAVLGIAAEEDTDAPADQRLRCRGAVRVDAYNAVQDARSEARYDPSAEPDTREVADTVAGTGHEACALSRVYEGEAVGVSGVVDGGARPTPWALPPDGYHFEAAVQHGGWTAPAFGAGRCRWGASRYQKACGKTAVASLMRSNGPWDYCADHLYGRWIEDGKVMGWRLVEDV